MQPGSAQSWLQDRKQLVAQRVEWPGLASKRTKVWKRQGKPSPLHLLLYVVPSVFALTMARAAR